MAIIQLQLQNAVSHEGPEGNQNTEYENALYVLVFDMLSLSK